MDYYYQVKYFYYKYNSGNADNGHYDNKISFNSLSEAKEFINQIKNIIDNKKMNKEEPLTEIEDNLIPDGGFFTKYPELYKVTVEEIYEY